MNREDYQDKWEKIVTRGFSNYQSLTESEKAWFLIEPIIIDGLIDHYVNYGAEHNTDLLNALQNIGMESVTKLFVEANELFANQVPIDINQRNNEIVSWPENKSQKFKDLDDEFWKCSEELERKLHAYLVSKSAW